MKYREYFKELLKEDPDGVEFQNRAVEWDVEGFSTMLVYNDIIERKLITASIQYETRGYYENCWSDNDTVKLELETFFKNDINDPLWNSVIQRKSLTTPISRDDFQFYLKMFSYQTKSSVTHSNLINILNLIGRKSGKINDYSERDKLPVTARMFKSTSGQFIIAFWKDKEEIRPYKNQIIQYIHALNIYPETVYYQSIDMYEDEFLPMAKFFNTPSNQLSDLQKKEKEIAQQLHVNKALLDKALLDALASKPKDVNQLYAALEKQLDMPIAKIKHIFNDFPLDKVIKRAVHEYVKLMENRD